MTVHQLGARFNFEETARTEADNDEDGPGKHRYCSHAHDSVSCHRGSHPYRPERSGVAGLSYALENGVEDFASDPDAIGGPNSFRLSTRVGGTSTDAAAALVSDFSDPSQLSAAGSTSVSVRD